MEKYINFNTKKRSKAKKEFEKNYYKLLNFAFYGKILGNVGNRLRLEFIKKDEYKI